MFSSAAAHSFEAAEDQRLVPELFAGPGIHIDDAPKLLVVLAFVNACCPGDACAPRPDAPDFQRSSDR